MMTGSLIVPLIPIDWKKYHWIFFQSFRCIDMSQSLTDIDMSQSLTDTLENKIK